MNTFSMDIEVVDSPHTANTPGPRNIKKVNVRSLDGAGMASMYIATEAVRGSMRPVVDGRTLKPGKRFRVTGQLSMGMSYSYAPVIHEVTPLI